MSMLDPPLVEEIVALLASMPSASEMILKPPLPLQVTVASLTLICQRIVSILDLH